MIHKSLTKKINKANNSISDLKLVREEKFSNLVMDAKEDRTKDPKDSIYEVLPRELVEIVINLVPRHQRLNIALASKELYEQVCDMDKFNRVLALNPTEARELKQNIFYMSLLSFCLLCPAGFTSRFDS